MAKYMNMHGMHGFEQRRVGLDDRRGCCDAWCRIGNRGREETEGIQAHLEVRRSEVPETDRVWLARLWRRSLPRQILVGRWNGNEDE
jgi:hypothetical protein